MKKIYDQYLEGQIDRDEALSLVAEKLEVDADKLEEVYEEYFKPSQEDSAELINGAYTGYTNDLEFEEKAFEAFLFTLSKEDPEKIREIKELATTI